MWMMPLHLHINKKSDYDDDERERLVQAHQSKLCIRGLTSREREMCVCVLFEFRQFVFFTLGTCLRISKFCVDLCKKNLIV